MALDAHDLLKQDPPPPAHPAVSEEGRRPPRDRGVDQEVVCVLGMHRTGSSLLMRLLNLLGVYLGPEQALMAPQPDNEKGFWECTELVDINDEVLAALGGTWDAPPAFSPGWANAPALEELRRRARALVADRFAGHSCWGWKDPRTSLTLPFWREILEPDLYVICVRDPAEVAASLGRRNQLPLERSAQLWLAYTTASLVGTSGRKRLLVFYDDLMRGWESEFDRLAAFVGRSDAAADLAVRTAAGEFVAQDMRHHSVRLVDSLEDPALPFEVQALYGALRFYACGGDVRPAACPPQADLDRALDALASRSATERRLKDEDKTSENWRLTDENRRLTEESRRLSEETARLTRERARLDQEKGVLDERLAESQRRFSAAEAALQEIFGSRGWRLLTVLRRIRTATRLSR